MEMNEETIILFVDPYISQLLHNKKSLQQHWFLLAILLDLSSNSLRSLVSLFFFLLWIPVALKGGLKSLVFSVMLFLRSSPHMALTGFWMHFLFLFLNQNLSKMFKTIGHLSAVHEKTLSWSGVEVGNSHVSWCDGCDTHAQTLV